MANSRTSAPAKQGRPALRGFLSALPLLALLAGCAAKKAGGPLLLHPVPPAGPPYALEQGALVFAGPGFRVSARPLDWRLVEEHLARAGEKSPFGDQPGDAGRFLFLQVRLENHSPKRLVFNPLQAALRGPNAGPVLPLDTSDLHAFAGEDRDAEARSRVFRSLSFDGQATLRPGESLERFLVFPSPEEAKPLTLTLEEIWLGAESFDLQFPFEAFPGR